MRISIVLDDYKVESVKKTLDQIASNYEEEPGPIENSTFLILDIEPENFPKLLSMLELLGTLTNRKN